MAAAKRYDLEDRTFVFAKDVRKFIKQIPKNICNIEDCKQHVRASGSVGANYMEANESFSMKDFKFRIKISREKVKESSYWLKLIDARKDEKLENARTNLLQESTELLKIFSFILIKSK